MGVNRDLFWELLEPEYAEAISFCRKLMGERDGGDDLFQDALVLALTRLKSLRDQSAFRPWLYRIMVNCFRSEVRRPWWKRRATLTDETVSGLVGNDPETAHAARRWLERAFRALTPDDRAMVILYELEGWPVAELAELYGRSEGAVKVRLHRARRKMKDALSHYLDSAAATAPKDEA